jgi:hypothetical protein
VNRRNPNPLRERGTIHPKISLAYASGYDQHQLQVAALVRWEMRTLAIVLSLSLSDVGHHAINECRSQKMNEGNGEGKNMLGHKQEQHYDA